MRERDHPRAHSLNRAHLQESWVKQRLRLIVALTTVTLAASAGDARSRPAPIKNPALLNMGFVCKWQDRCIRRQQQAMNRSIRYVKRAAVPAWKIRLCNRNSARGGTRKDWIGFDNCIRNPALRPPRATARGR